MYQYKLSGLDNVFLLNGYHHHKTSEGTGVSVDDLDGLHRAIGRFLIEAPKPLNGAELRFLRLEMDLSQSHLAGIIGSTEQNIRRWEKQRKRPISGPADRLLRALYQEFIGEDGSVRRMLDRLAGLDQIEGGRVTVKRKSDAWVTTCC
jgi:DNA-binding transcriptional regulator YiaG